MLSVISQLIYGGKNTLKEPLLKTTKNVTNTKRNVVVTLVQGSLTEREGSVQLTSLY